MINVLCGVFPINFDFARVAVLTVAAKSFLCCSWHLVRRTYLRFS